MQLTGNPITRYTAQFCFLATGGKPEAGGYPATLIFLWMIDLMTSSPNGMDVKAATAVTKRQITGILAYIKRK